MEAQEKTEKNGKRERLEKKEEMEAANLSHKGVRMPWAQALTEEWDSKL